MNESCTNSALAVSYEAIELQSHYTYRKKKFIEKIISNQGKQEDVDSGNFIEGMLIIDYKNKRLLFKPHDFLTSPDLTYYQETFYKKMSIKFSNIKNIMYVNKNNEHTVKSPDSINKAFKSFIIYCYDFRTYSYNRLGIHNKNEAIKFFQDLTRTIFEKNMEKDKYIIWKNIDQSILFSIYHNNVHRNITVRLNIIRNYPVFTPTEIFNNKDVKNYFEFGPQVIYYSEHNQSYLMICDKSCDKKLETIIKNISMKIIGPKIKEIKNPIIFYLNNDSSDNKSEIIFPTNKELNECFEKLFSLCTPRNKAEFKRSDKKWMTKLSECGWLNLISRCFQLTRTILKSISNPNICVYLIEIGYSVWGWLFGSLVQLVCQPTVRTISGFLSLIEKNWILSGAYSNQDGTKPQLFLLFLDCVHQLLRTSSFQFEFNEELLICIYDLFILSPSGFMNSQDYNFSGINWCQFFVDQVIDCLENRFYDKEESECCFNLSKIDTSDFGSFWFKMYARWIPYVQVECGSMSVRHYYMTVSLLLDNSVHSNYPFSLNYDKVTMYSDYNNNDDTRSIATVVSDEF